MDTRQFSIRIAVLCFVSSSLAACTLAVHRVEPRPNIDLPSAGKTLALKLDESVRDNNSSALGALTYQVTDWHASLTAGFKNAFAQGFELRQVGKPDYTLQIVEASPLLMPKPRGASNVAFVQIRYKARLVDADGQILKRLSGGAKSKQVCLSISDMERCTSDAIESLYEEIAVSFFNASVSGVTPAVQNQASP